MSVGSAGHGVVVGKRQMILEKKPSPSWRMSPLGSMVMESNRSSTPPNDSGCWWRQATGRAFDGCTVVSGPAGCWGDGVADGVAGGAAVLAGALLGSDVVTLLPGLVCSAAG